MANSRNIPVRMPEDLYQDLLADKPTEMKVSSWLLIVLRKGLSVTVDKSSTFVDNLSTSDLADKIREEVDGLATSIRSELQSAIAPIKEQLGECLGKCDFLAAENQALRERLSDINHVPNIESQIANPATVPQEVKGQLRMPFSEQHLTEEIDASIQEPIERPKQQRTQLLGETFKHPNDLPNGSVSSIKLAELCGVDSSNIGRWQKKEKLGEMTKKRTGKAYKYAGKLDNTNYYCPCADLVDH